MTITYQLVSLSTRNNQEDNREEGALYKITESTETARRQRNGGSTCWSLRSRLKEKTDATRNSLRSVRGSGISTRRQQHDGGRPSAAALLEHVETAKRASRMGRTSESIDDTSSEDPDWSDIESIGWD